MRCAKHRATKFQSRGMFTKFTVAAERNYLHFGLDGRAKILAYEFRTALLSYLWKRSGWIWRMVCAGPAFVAGIRVEFVKARKKVGSGLKLPADPSKA